MSEHWTISWAWWITAVEVPTFGCLFWLIRDGRREAQQALLKVYREIQGNLNVVLENLAQSKLEVAHLYATIGDLKDVEKRLTDHLLRLETRLTYTFRSERRTGDCRSCPFAERTPGEPGQGDADAA
jgi:hypothetical protein